MDPTLETLPDELLAVVFGFCDPKTLAAAVPAVSRRWLGVCQALPAVDLACRVALTDAGLAGLARRFPRLRSLDLAHNGEVTDAGLNAVAVGCPNLAHLDLAGCYGLTDAGLAAIAGCPRLVHLDLYGCYKLTAGGVAAVVAGCPNLAEYPGDRSRRAPFPR